MILHAKRADYLSTVKQAKDEVAALTLDIFAFVGLNKILNVVLIWLFCMNFLCFNGLF